MILINMLTHTLTKMLIRNQHESASSLLLPSQGSQYCVSQRCRIIISPHIVVIHFEPNPPTKKKPRPTSCLPHPSPKLSHKNSISNMTLWVCLHSPLHVLAHASAAWFFVLLLLPVKRPQGFKVKVIMWLRYKSTQNELVQFNTFHSMPWGLKFGQFWLIA